jgi:hypothetical protein
MSTFAGDLKQQIGQKGDEAWEALLKTPDDGPFIDPPLSAHEIAANLGEYKNNLMLFPEFSFDEFVTDRNGNKYYYSGEDASGGLFLIKYDNRITDMLQKYTYAMGSAGEENWQMIGSIKEVFTWWGDVVLMEIKALRIESKVAVILEGDSLNFVAEELLDQYMDEKAAAGLGDVPKNLSSIPDGLDPRTVADLYFQVSSAENNKDVWLQLLNSDNFYGGKPERRVDTYWNNLTKEGRSFFFVRIATDEATTKKYFYQIRENGVDVGSPKPLTVVLENGEWKVKSGI